MAALEVILSSIVLILSLTVYLIKRKYSYWKDMGIPSEEPVFPYGNIKGLGREHHFSSILSRLYYKFKSLGTPFVGLYFYLSPVVLVTSLDFVKTVLVRDAANFIDRVAYYNEKDGKFL